MQKRIWIRAGAAVVAVSALLALAGLAAPSLLNIDQYKPAMIAAVKEATGRELVIEGPLKLTVFPTLRISARQVHFANAVGARGAQMVDVRWIGITPSMWALLQGRIEVGRLTLFRPTLVLETDAEGRPNWEFKPGAGAAQPAGLGPGPRRALGHPAVEGLAQCLVDMRDIAKAESDIDQIRAAIR